MQRHLRELLLDLERVFGALHLAHGEHRDEADPRHDEETQQSDEHHGVTLGMPGMLHGAARGRPDSHRATRSSDASSRVLRRTSRDASSSFSAPAASPVNTQLEHVVQHFVGALCRCHDAIERVAFARRRARRHRELAHAVVELVGDAAIALCALRAGGRVVARRHFPTSCELLACIPNIAAASPVLRTAVRRRLAASSACGCAEAGDAQDASAPETRRPISSVCRRGTLSFMIRSSALPRGSDPSHTRAGILPVELRELRVNVGIQSTRDCAGDSKNTSLMTAKNSAGLSAA